MHMYASTVFICSFLTDIDYCDLNLCPINTTCTYHGPGNYTCTCPSEPIHVVLSADSMDFPGMFPLLNSLKQHHTKPLTIHIVVSGKDRKKLEIQLACRDLMKNMKVH